MQGRLLPARGGPVSPLTIREVIKAAQAKAHRDTSVQIIEKTFAGLAKKAEGELGAALRSTVGSLVRPELGFEEAQRVADTQIEDYGTSPSQEAEPVRPEKGLGNQWAPVSADKMSLGLHEDGEKLSSVLSSLFSGELRDLDALEKRAYLGRLLTLGRGLAGHMAARGGRVGRVGRFLQRDIRSPIQAARTGPASASVGVRSPLAPSRTPPPIPADAAKAGPYRAAAKPSAEPARRAPGRVKDKKPKTVKPQSLTGALLPGALMLGAGYGLYKGVPAVADWATRAASSPMAYNLGHQQYMYGYGPGGQAKF
jgi:hypothetical protein